MNNQVDFCDIPTGAKFCHRSNPNSIFIKTSIRFQNSVGAWINAICIDDGIESWFAEDDKFVVIPDVTERKLVPLNSLDHGDKFRYLGGSIFVKLRRRNQLGNTICIEGHGQGDFYSINPEAEVEEIQ